MQRMQQIGTRLEEGGRRDPVRKSAEAFIEPRVANDGLDATGRCAALDGLVALHAEREEDRGVVWRCEGCGERGDFGVDLRRTVAMDLTTGSVQESVEGSAVAVVGSVKGHEKDLCQAECG